MYTGANEESREGEELSESQNRSLLINTQARVFIKILRILVGRVIPIKLRDYLRENLG